MDGLTIMILICAAALVFSFVKAIQLITIEIIEDIEERRRACRRRRGYRRGSTHARSTGTWHGYR